MFPLLQTPINLLPDSIPSIKEEIKQVQSLPFDDLINNLVTSAVHFTIDLVTALIVFYIGKLIIKRIYRVVSAVMTRRKVDRSLATFILSMIKIVLYFLLIVIVIGILGIETSSFIALFASAGVAIGMALSGTLQNFAGGVLILLLKPYKVGDYIEAQGFAGYVREIQIFHTIICTYDNKTIIIPNGGLSTGSVNNWSRQDYRRVEWTVSIAYGDNVAKARRAILSIFASDDRIVAKYIEDDRARYEAQQQAIAETQAESETVEEEKPHGRLWRMFHRRVRQHVEQISQDIPTPTEALGTARVDRSPSVTVEGLDASSVTLKARAWVRSEHYWSLYYDMYERLYSELPDAGVHFPFPQLDVHLTHQ